MSVLYNRYGVSFLKVKGPGYDIEHPIILAPKLKKCRVTPLWSKGPMIFQHNLYRIPLLEIKGPGCGIDLPPILVPNLKKEEK